MTRKGTFQRPPTWQKCLDCGHDTTVGFKGEAHIVRRMRAGGMQTYHSKRCQVDGCKCQHPKRVREKYIMRSGIDDKFRNRMVGAID